MAPPGVIIAVFISLADYEWHHLHYDEDAVDSVMNSTREFPLKPAPNTRPPICELEVLFQEPGDRLLAVCPDHKLARPFIPSFGGTTTEELAAAMSHPVDKINVHLFFGAVKDLQRYPGTGKFWCSWESVLARVASCRTYSIVQAVAAAMLNHKCEPADLVMLDNGRLGKREGAPILPWEEVCYRTSMYVLQLAAAQHMTVRELHCCIDFAKQLFRGNFPSEHECMAHAFLEGVSPNRPFPRTYLTRPLARISAIVQRETMRGETQHHHQLLVALWEQAKTCGLRKANNYSVSFERGKCVWMPVENELKNLDYVAFPTHIDRVGGFCFDRWVSELSDFRQVDPFWTDDMTAVVMRTILEVQRQVEARKHGRFVKCPIRRMLIMSDGTVRWGAKLADNYICCSHTYSGCWQCLVSHLLTTFAALVKGNLEVGEAARGFLMRLSYEFRSVSDALKDPFVAGVQSDTDIYGEPCFRLLREEQLPKPRTEPLLLRDVVTCGVQSASQMANEALLYGLLECNDGRSFPSLDDVTVKSGPIYGRRDQATDYDGHVPYKAALTFHRKAAHMSGEPEDSALVMMLQEKTLSLDQLIGYWRNMVYSWVRPADSMEF